MSKDVSKQIKFKPEPTLQGRDLLRKGPQEVGYVSYTVHLNPSNNRASVVAFHERLPCEGGDVVTLTLEDGRIVNCQVLDDTPYCAVIGDAPLVERRKTPGPG